jgi:chromosome segregation ATPase
MIAASIRHNGNNVRFSEQGAGIATFYVVLPDLFRDHMMPSNLSSEELQADIDALRERFPRTADLYREACAVMFFRYGIAPTTNALYQLVRKGSMSAPSDALRRFWTDLREKARIVLPDGSVPDELRETAGQLLGQIWTFARAAAEQSATNIKNAALAERDEAFADKAKSDERAGGLTLRLESIQAALASAEEEMAQQRIELGAAAATMQGLNARLGDAQADVDRLQREATVIAKAHADELDRVTSRVAQAELRYVELEKRALVELDRERTAASKVQKQLELERRAALTKIEEANARSQVTQAQVNQQSQELAAYKAKLDLLTTERDRSIGMAAEASEARFDLANLLAAERARIEELREQLREANQRTSSLADAVQTAQAVRRRQRKPASKAT